MFKLFIFEFCYSSGDRPPFIYIKGGRSPLSEYCLVRGMSEDITFRGLVSYANQIVPLH